MMPVISWLLLNTVYVYLSLFGSKDEPCIFPNYNKRNSEYYKLI